jgi:hypothetical protein
MTALAALSGVAAATAVVALPTVPALFGHPAGAPAAVLASVAASWLAALIGIVPLAVRGPAGVMPAIWGYFLGAAVRMVLCVAAAGAFIKLARWPAGPVAVTLVGSYLLLLLVETKIAARYLLAKDAGGAAAKRTESQT